MPVLTNARRDAFIMDRGEGWPIHVVGADMTIKISSRDTDGAFAVFEDLTQLLQGPPLHRHLEQDEWWYIVEGEFKFEVDGREILASAGATVFAPRGSCHSRFEAHHLFKEDILKTTMKWIRAPRNNTGVETDINLRRLFRAAVGISFGFPRKCYLWPLEK